MRAPVLFRALCLLLLAGCGRAPEPGPQPVDTAEARLRRGLVSVSADESPGYVLDWQPPVVSIESDRAAHARAAQALAAGQLYQDERSAIPIYLALRARDPADAQARAGLERALAALLAEGQNRLQDFEVGDAELAPVREIAAVARSVAPDLPATLDFLARVDAADRLLALTEHGEHELAAGRLGVHELGALTAFREVLRNRPQDARARRGIDAVQAAVLERAEAAAAADDFMAAARHLQDAAAVRPGSPAAVAQASRRVELQREKRVARLNAEAARLLVDPDAHGALRQVQARIDRMRAVALPGDRRIRILQARLALAARYGRFLPGQRFRDAMPDGTSGPQLVVVPAGRFLMGAPKGEKGATKAEQPQHAVVFRRGFAMAQTETTVGEYARFVAASGYRTRAERRGHAVVYDERSGNFVLRNGIDWRRDYAGRPAAANLPVLHLNVGDAEAYAQWLSARTGHRYRLPHEAEFEYALRAGTQARYAWGEHPPRRGSGNYTGAHDRSPSGRRWGNAFPGYGDGHWGPAPVGRFRANRFGLHDLDGNLSEWTTDCWHQGYRRAPGDGGPWYNPGCRNRVVRGGSWSSAPVQIRAAWRMSQAHDVANARTGFRLVREI